MFRPTTLALLLSLFSSMAVAQDPVVRINSGGNPYVDPDGAPWDTDFGYGPSLTFTNAQPIAGTDDDLVFQSERYGLASQGGLDYSFDLPDGDYRVRLLLAELWYQLPGQRVFDIAVEGALVADNLDLAGTYGRFVATVLEYDVSVTDGSLDLEFLPVVQNPKVNGIEIYYLGDTNFPPVVTSMAPSTGVAGELLSYAVTADDPNPGDTLTYSLEVAPAGATIDPVSGLLTWTPSSGQVGLNAFTVRATDSGALFGEQSFDVQVIPMIAGNQAPTITTTAPMAAVDVGGAFAYDVDASDPDLGAGDELTYSLEVAPAGATIDAATGVIMWSPAPIDTGFNDFTVRVTDLGGLFDEQSFAVEVLPGAGDLALYRINCGGPEYLGMDGTTWSSDDYFTGGGTFSTASTVIGTDDPTLYKTERWDSGGGSNLVYSLPVSPGSYLLRIHLAEIYFTTVGKRVFQIEVEGEDPFGPIDMVAEAGPFTAYVKEVVVQATDGSIDLEWFHITQNPKVAALELFPLSSDIPPVITSTAPTQVIGGAVYTYDVQASDLNPGDTLTYSLETAPAGAVIDPANGEIDWPTTAGDVGPHAFTVRVTDSADLFDEQSFTVQVSAPPPDNLPPTFVSVAPTGVTLPDAYSYDADATDPDAGDVITYSLPVGPAGVTINGTTGVIDWAPTTDAIGTHDFTVRATDLAGDFSEQSFTVTVMEGVHRLLLSDGTSSGGGPVDVEVRLDAAAVVQGWSFGVCNDASLEATAVVNGAVTAAFNGGAGPDFQQINLYPEGWNVGTVISFPKTDSLAPGYDHHLFTATYTPLVSAPPLGSTSSTLDFCEFGSPPVEIAVTVDGASQDPELFGSTITIEGESVAVHRINCGGGEYTATDGAIWTADNGFVGGSTFSTTQAVAGTSEQTIYKSERWDPPAAGNTLYSLPVAAGNYLVRVHIAEIYFTAVGKRVMELEIEGENPFGPIDAVSEAGPFTALIKEHTVEVTDGSLEIEMLRITQNPRINGIEVILLGSEVPPTITSTPPTVITADSELSYQVVATDVNPSDTLTFSLEDGPAAAGIDPITGLLTWTPTGSDVGFHGFTVRVTDSTDLFTEQGFTVEVVPAGTFNNPPSFTSTPITSAQAGETYTYDADAFDPDVMDTLTYSLLTAPAAASIDPVTGLITWATTSTDLGVHEFIVQVADDEGLTADQAFNVSIYPAGSSGDLVFRLNAGAGEYVAGDGSVWAADFGYTAGGSYSTTSSIADTPDPTLYQSERYATFAQGDLHYSFPLDPGNYLVRLHFAEIYYTTTGKRVFGINLEGQTFYDSVDLVAEAGPFTAHIKDAILAVTDGTLNIEIERFVQNPKISAIEVFFLGDDIPPAITSTAPTEATADLQYSYAVIAQDLNPGDTLSYSLEIAPAFAQINMNTGLITWTPVLADLGSHPFTVRVTDSTGLFAEQSFTVNVSEDGGGNVAPVLTSTPSTTVVEGATYTYDAEADDPGDALTYSLPTAPVAASIDPVSGIVTWATTSADLGTHPFVVRVTDSGGLFDEQSFNVQVVPQGGIPAVHRINAGGGAYTSTNGEVWAADQLFAGGGTYATTSSIVGTTDQPVYKTERFDGPGGSNLVYNLPVVPGNYLVRLHMAELYFTTPSTRVFGVQMEGQTVLSNFDIVAEAGAFAALTKDFTLQVTDGTLNIEFFHVIQNPKVNGIEVFDQGALQLLVADSSTVAFPTTEVGLASAPQTLTLTNTADGPITIDGMTLTGDFSIDSALSLPITLDPGESQPVDLVFAPTAVGQTLGSIDIEHSGDNSPLEVALSGTGFQQGVTPVGFGASNLFGETSSKPTSLQFGPDGRLYVADQLGLIKVYTVERNSANDYEVVGTEIITNILDIPNHNDDGSPAPSVTARQITGIVVTGTPTNPVLYVGSSDPRHAVASTAPPSQSLDTNSGVISRLTWNGSSWDHIQLVQGIPRSAENHSINGMTLLGDTLYVCVSGNTNMGAPSTNFSGLMEYAYATAIITVDLNAIGDTTYAMPTLDDEDRAGVDDLNDPFGGNLGKNQAKVVPGSPIEIYSTGWRNVYDLVIASNGEMYAVDNGPNAGWGGIDPTCSNVFTDGGLTLDDNLHHVSGPGYYAGHPNYVRANANITFNASNPQSPILVENPVECEYLMPGIEDGALELFPSSTNGIHEYRASNFGGAMQGDLLTASMGGQVWRLQLNEVGDGLIGPKEALFSGFGAQPLDVWAQDDFGPFPGTVWVACYASGTIAVFEPNDYEGGGVACSGADDPALDEDNDGYSNADEIDNGTNPCSGASVPEDFDGDFVSNLNDPDDDNDGLDDLVDTFPVDAENGMTTTLPVEYSWDNEDPRPGALLDLGWTGLMKNDGQDYLGLYDPNPIIAGGAAGVMTLAEATAGDAVGATNTQEFGFQFGVNVSSTMLPFVVQSRVQAPFAALTPTGDQSMGIFFGTGDQDNYCSLTVVANEGVGGVRVRLEQGGVPTDAIYGPAQGVSVIGAEYVVLNLVIDPSTHTAQPRISLSGAQPMDLGLPFSIPASWLGPKALAVGVISTTAGEATFPATWAFFNVLYESDVPTFPRALVEVDTGASLLGSTYTNGSIQITNGSFGGQYITRVELDLSDTVLPDIVFDPDGTAGDTTAKCFTPNAGAAATGLIPYTDNCSQPFSLPYQLGYLEVAADFSDFGPGETFTFSVDVDPTSVQGTPAPGPGDSASVSGLELTGARFRVTFDDGSTLEGPLFPVGSSLGESSNVLEPAPPAAPLITVAGVSSPSVVTSSPNLNVQITGEPDSIVTLAHFEGALYTTGLPGGGFDIDPFEANSYLGFTKTDVQLSPSGTAIVPITLVKSNAVGGYNYLTAVTRAGQGGHSDMSNLLVYQYDPDALTPQTHYRINCGGPAIAAADGTASWEADTQAAPSLYVNTAEAGSYTFVDAGASVVLDPSVGPAVPVNLFKTQRFDPLAIPEMQWSFPVPNGTYEVRLYFAEIFAGAATPGGRLFTGTLEEATILQDYDIFSLYGFELGVEESFVVTIDDGAIDLQFFHVVENPAIAGIEILPYVP